MPTGEVFMYGWIISWIRLIPRPFQVYLESLTNCRNSRWSSQSNDLNHLKNQPCCFASVSFFCYFVFTRWLDDYYRRKKGCWTYEGERHFDGYRKRQLDVSEHLTGPQKRKNYTMCSQGQTRDYPDDGDKEENYYLAQRQRQVLLC